MGAASHCSATGSEEGSGSGDGLWRRRRVGYAIKVVERNNNSPLPIGGGPGEGKVPRCSLLLVVLPQSLCDSSPWEGDVNGITWVKKGEWTEGDAMRVLRMLLLGAVLGGLGKARAIAQEQPWWTDLWKPLLTYQGVEITYLYLYRAGGVLQRDCTSAAQPERVPGRLSLSGGISGR